MRVLIIARSSSPERPCVAVETRTYLMSDLWSLVAPIALQRLRKAALKALRFGKPSHTFCR